jgi:hypothetical protein
MVQEQFIFRSVSKGGRQRVRKVNASTFEIAKEKAIDQFSHIIHFKQKTMDLNTAVKRAKEASKKTQRTHYIINDGDGECSINTAPLSGVMDKYVNGERDKNFKPHATDAIEDTGKAKTKTLPAQSAKAEKLIAQKTAKETAAKESKKSNSETMKNEKNKSVKKAAPKKVAAKKATKKVKGEKTRALDAPIKGGAAKIIFDAIKKKPHTKEQLAKLADTKETNISWYLNKIRNNGHDVQNTEKGYSIK